MENENTYQFTSNIKIHKTPADMIPNAGDMIDATVVREALLEAWNEEPLP